MTDFVKRDLYHYSCNLIKVVDGDTLIVLADLGFKVYKQLTLRIARINAPELNSAEGKLSKQFLVDLFKKENVNITFTSKSLDIYGRSIAEMYISGIDCIDKYNLADSLVSKGMAVYKEYKK